jgi:UDP-N-acetylmuramyl pentapeptide phosphotransferase/UDP-N-acetylglucosamine-1-phosphate transferase
MFIIFLYILTISITLIFIQSKYLFLVDAPREQTHKSKYNKNTPLTGGIYIFITIATYMPFADFSNHSILMTMFLFSFLILGIFSDLKTNFSPKLRLILQSFLVIVFILLLELKINKTGLFFLEYFISNTIFNLFFSSVCIIILINGSNFCDGVNCNVIGYYLIVALALFFIELPKPASFPNIKIIIIIFSIFYFVNLFQKSFLGDNGVYVITVFMGVYVINFINLNNNVSPLLALNLLWYPAFENLFTIIRRLNANRTVDAADGFHFHTLLLKKIFQLNKNFLLSNSLTGLLINLFMLSGIFLSINYYDDAKVLTFILMVNIIIYVLFYFTFLSRKPKFKSHEKD